MNENKGKMSTVLIVALIAIIILLSVAVVFLVKNQVSTNIAQGGNKTNIEEKIDNTNTANKEENNSEETETKVVTKDMTADEKYKVYAEGMKKSIRKFKGAGEVYEEGQTDVELGENCQNIWTAEENGIMGIYLDYTGTAYLRLNTNKVLGKKYGEKYKIASNIIKVGANAFGQDDSLVAWALDDEGKLHYAFIGEVDASTLEVKEYNKLKDIVDIDQYNYISLCAIDIEGNIYELEF